MKKVGCCFFFFFLQPVLKSISHFGELATFIMHLNQICIGWGMWEYVCVFLSRTWVLEKSLWNIMNFLLFFCLGSVPHVLYLSALRTCLREASSVLTIEYLLTPLNHPREADNLFLVLAVKRWRETWFEGFLTILEYCLTAWRGLCTCRQEHS